MRLLSLLSRLIFFGGGLFILLFGAIAGVMSGNMLVTFVLPAVGLFFMAKGLWIAAIVG